MSLDGLWNRSVAELNNLDLIGVDLICNKDICISALVTWHFFMVPLQILCMPLFVKVSHSVFNLLLAQHFPSDLKKVSVRKMKAYLKNNDFLF